MAKSPAYEKNPIQIFTDGSFWNGRGGYAAVFVYIVNGQKYVKGVKSSSSYGNTTHNRMELRAILAALKRVDTGYRIDIYSDSQYCTDNFKRLGKWMQNGRIRSVKNNDLWREIWKQYRRHKKHDSVINVSWIRGHAGNEYNEMADDLASQARGNWKVSSCKPGAQI